MQIRLTENQEILPGYRLVRKIGRGRLGEVWLATNETGVTRAVKVSPLDRHSAEPSSPELDGLRKISNIRHPYLLSIDRFDIVGNHLVVLMEPAEKTLHSHYRQCRNAGDRGIRSEELIILLSEAAEALDDLSQRGNVQHLNINPHHLLMTSGHIRVADFSTVREKNTTEPIPLEIVHPAYLPWEVLRDGRITPAVDVFSMAVTYVEMLAGSRPHRGSEPEALIAQQLQREPDLFDVPEHQRKAIARALDREWQRRFRSCTELVEALGFRSSAHSIGASVLVDSGKAVEKLTAVVAAAEPTVEEGRVRDSFVGYLPTELFNQRLDRFLTADPLETVTRDSENVELWRGERGWFGKRKSGLVVRVTTHCPNPASSHRIVDIIVEAAPACDEEELIRQGKDLIRRLRASILGKDGGSSESGES